MSMLVKCAQCGAAVLKDANAVNRAAKIGAPLFCNKTCFGLSRRLVNPPTLAEKKEAKRLYDAARRIDKGDEIRAKKRAFYYANHERLKAAQAAYRAANMHKHVEYCRQPDYREYKAAYDRQHRARKLFGEFSDAAMILTDIEREVLERATRYEIQLTNGTLNKAQNRRRAL